jgi:hypothetical protein
MIRIDAWRQNLEYVEDRIQKATNKAGRKREDIQLIVVTKTHSADIVEELLELGVRDIGESYVQEGIEKKRAIAELGRDFGGVHWHMIGHVQSRKAENVAEHFDSVHSVDSVKLARRLNKFAGEHQKRLPALLQVNVSGEASKYGFEAEDESGWLELAGKIEEIAGLENIEIQGLMSIPPFDTNEKVARENFSKTRRLRDMLAQKFTEINWKHLSMGMSADYETAILEGASMLRLGTAILGRREK